MHPRLQTAFDVMYAKAEQFIELPLQKKCTEYIREGDYEVAAGVACDALLTARMTSEKEKPAHRSAVAAFNEFWAVFTELTYGAVRPPLPPKGGN